MAPDNKARRRECQSLDRDVRQARVMHPRQNSRRDVFSRRVFGSSIIADISNPSSKERVMAITDDDLWQIKTGAAVLVSCLVRAMEKTDPNIRAQVLEILSEDYYTFRDNYDGDVPHIVEMISWTRKSLKSGGKPRLVQSRDT
jgi:hypothetical protein